MPLRFDMFRRLALTTPLAPVEITDAQRPTAASRRWYASARTCRTASN